MKRAILIATGLTMMVSGLVPGSVHAGPGACSVGQMCVSRNTGGTGELYEFASNDSRLNNNNYNGGVQVSDHILSTRNRNASFTRACVYQDFDYSGTILGNAPYSGATWVSNVNELGSSIRWQGATC